MPRFLILIDYKNVNTHKHTIFKFFYGIFSVFLISRGLARNFISCVINVINFMKFGRKRAAMVRSGTGELRNIIQEIFWLGMPRLDRLNNHLKSHFLCKNDDTWS